MSDLLTILTGDCRTILPTLADESVNCVVTSPPYWGLRDYKNAKQIGQEKTPNEFVAEMVAVFQQMRRILTDDGTCWINLGDSYARNGGTQGSGNRELLHMDGKQTRMLKIPESSGLKAKDLVGIPWMVAFALRADGWYLRQDIIWSKPNPMPESVEDRCTKAHEYIFLLSKSERYHFDNEAIAEPAIYGDNGSSFTDTRDLETHKGIGKTRRTTVARGGFNGKTNANPGQEAFRAIKDTRNKRSVWTVPSSPYKGSHFAPFPPDLIKPCILAGCPVGGTVLDPFGGSGTTGKVALELGRKAILIELNPEYAALCDQRTNVTPGLALT